MDLHKFFVGWIPIPILNPQKFKVEKFDALMRWMFFLRDENFYFSLTSFTRGVGIKN
jgi:hypothetical protein